MTPAQAQELNNFWFGQGSLDNESYVGARMKLWFGKKNEFDKVLRGSFAPWLDEPAGTGRDRLAEIILFDQIPRNAFRDTPRMYAYDEQARNLAQLAIARRAHQALHPIKAAFVVMPLEHSENIEDQDISVRLMEEIDARAPVNLKSFTQSTLEYAKKHRDVIARFGRFPHRNSILNRASTEAEAQFLSEPGSRF